jgi:endonuclease/exonuclease/phosphatase family metal-dependent hydrolase
MGKIRVLSYNIHKGFDTANFNFVLNKIKKSIETVHADLVFLQEVLGHHEKHKSRIVDWPTVPQFEYLADQLWPHFAYGKNAVYTYGHHGNAILSKYPIIHWENVDISTNRLERRGLLHIEVKAPHISQPLHAICVHLGLFEAGRKIQINELCNRISKLVGPEFPLIVGGDFNDWREKATPILQKKLNLKEIFMEVTGKHAKTFPSWLPALKLDRIYFRSLQPLDATVLTGGVWSELSDHAALCGEFEYDLT